MNQESSSLLGLQGSGICMDRLDNQSYYGLQEALLAQKNGSGQVMSQILMACLTLRGLHGMVWLYAGEAVRVDVVRSACQVPEHDLKLGQ